jgi:TolB-like protein/Flp pilus assembly protein TadD
VSLFDELRRRNVFRVAIAYAVVAWLLLQVGDTLVPALLLPEWTNRLLALLLILGFPLALFFAWAFELTPEGIKPEKSVRRDESIAPVTGRKLDRLIIALLAIAVVYFAWDKFVSREDVPAESSITAVDPAAVPVPDLDPGAERRAVAVLPFVNISNDDEQEYFSDGLAEEVLNLLAKIPQLRVTSRSSAFSFKGKDFTIADVGEALGVNYVLEGSVRRSGDQIRVTAQLIEVASDSHLWSETWDRAFEDVFAIQDEIAEAVTSALQIQLVDDLPHVFVTDPRAYDLYLQARELLGGQSEASALAAESLLLELLEIDPDYPPGLVLLGEAEMFLGIWLYRPLDASFERARDYAQRAIEASPTFSGAYRLLARIAFRHDRDLSLARRYIDEAIRHDPADVRAHSLATIYEALQGGNEIQVEFAQEVVRLDPLAGESYWALGHTLKLARQYDESVDAFRKMLAVSPDSTAVHAALAEVLLLAGEYEAALAEFDAEPLAGFTHYGHAMTYYEMGEQEKSDAALNALLSLDDVDGWAAQVAMAHAVRGEKDEAFRWLDRALELNDQGVFGVRAAPFFGNLRDDPRLDEFVKRLWKGQEM